jgi:transcriptional regulator with XRE-family HTH domain
MSKTQITAREHDGALIEAKLALVSARERGEPDALAHALRQHPAFADALTELDLALLATTGYEAEANAPDVVEIAEAARARAFVAVFGARPAVAPQSVVASQVSRSLKALRQAQGQRLPALAARLGLGVDVLSALESGRIRVASVPRRLREALAEVLDATAEQIGAALTVDLAPALRRGQPGASSRDAASQQLDFRDAEMLSQSMTQEQQARWLAESAQQ